MLNQRAKNVIFILVVAVLIALLVYQFIPRTKSQVRVNGAVDFKLESVDGKEYSISSFRGKKVILNFFATWCPPCRAEIPDFEKFHQSNKDIVLIGVNIQEDKNTVKEFLNSMGVSYLVLLDKDGKIASNFGIEGIPTTFLLDENGRIIAKNVGMMTYDELDKFVKQNKKD
ncbi:TlpA family protein disulfide reductase [Caldicellulosiruptor changbaiensis]|uniref:TlpA family protein disulfide reductase n=1 Tax=Caldicellulosiruptor changbaiensis TaxID=1222016 RepID=A0A3T0D7D8_9FIRM|nr:TlpA disulfide reductase family protein [Caldicellulosiruptor changbaiensis]AZT90876.1 TlpA family protein disulfide reductase [Caldicellulosiruptor changbaiensis]